MSNKSDIETTQARWARFRFSIIGSLLAAPPESGELKAELAILAKKEGRHPITGEACNLSVSTIERWFYGARHNKDPVGALRTKRRSDAGRSSTMSSKLEQFIQQQYREHVSWSYQLHFDNLTAIINKCPEFEQ